jgi:DNA-binding MarR family transcriptional regulator
MNMLAAALYYAERLHLHIFPCHEAVFNDAGACIGCTCEQYRQSDECRQNHPHLYLGPEGKCAKPGKCPRVRWKDKATNDPETIRRWWSRWPSANIGWVPGRDGYISLDLDSYKEHFAGADALSPTELQTITSLTQGGGQHLIFRKHDGATYSNSPGELPKGLDVRADNGYILLPPSLGASGNRYQRKPDYWFGEVEAQRLPERIHTMLLAAKAKSPAASVYLGEPSSHPPDLAAWALSERMIDAILHPAQKGGRSEADMGVCVALCYAGASDPDILNVFSHYPCGLLGKYAERGADYLARTIGAARQFVALHPRQEQGPPTFDEDAPGIPLSQLVAAAYDWLVTAECAAALRSAGFVRIEGPRKTLGALVDVAAQRGLRFIPGLRQIAELAGCSAMTIGRHLQQFQEAGLVELTQTDIGLKVHLKFVVPYCYKSNQPIVYTCNTTERQTFWHDHRSDDAFVSYPYRAAMRRRTMPTVLADSLGAAAALVWHMLVEHGELTRTKIGELSGMTPGSVATATRKLEAAGLLLVWQEGGRKSPKSYLLHPDAERRLDERRPEMKSYGVGLRRQLRHVQEQWDRARESENPKREMRLAQKYDRALAQVYPNWSEEDRLRFIYSPKPPGPHPLKVMTLERKLAEIRIDRAEQRHQEQWTAVRNLQQAIADLVRDRVPRRQWFDDLSYAGFTPGEIKRAMASIRFAQDMGAA